MCRVLLTALVAAGLLYCLIAISSGRIQHLDGIAHCVKESALAEGFAGNPYSQEAWDLFAKNCK